MNHADLTLESVGRQTGLLGTAREFSWFLEATGDLFFLLDRRGTILYTTRRTAETTGFEGDLCGMMLSDLIPSSDNCLFSEAIAEVMEYGTHRLLTLKLRCSMREEWFELQLASPHHENDEVRFVVVGRSVSRQMENEERLRHLANHDALTGLPNRNLLSDRIRMAIEHTSRTGYGFCILALDLDGFKKVNDALGHPVGDTLLQAASGRLRDTLRGIDTLARVGGDEFIVVLPNITDESVILAVAQRMIAAIQSPFRIGDHTLYVSTSIGAAVFPEHGDTEVRLLAHADTALYRAKETGKSRCVVYNERKFLVSEHDVSMEAAMFEAVRNGEFLLHYQPIVDAGAGNIMGFEVLMRWKHPEHGLISPNQFIPMAENNGLINLLGAWALKAACIQLRHFEEVFGNRLYMSVNVSPRQFRNEQFIETVDEAIRSSGIASSQLVLEITEGILMSDPEHAEGLLTAVSSRGVGIAIDDFGTGYSSLAYLKRFPITALKIDRSFIRDLPGSVKDAAICNVVMSLASHLNLKTVAEGVETEEQLSYLAAHGCTLIQGYHTGRPMTPESAMEMLHAACGPGVSRAGIAGGV